MSDLTPCLTVTSHLAASTFRAVCDSILSHRHWTFNPNRCNQILTFDQHFDLRQLTEEVNSQPNLPACNVRLTSGYKEELCIESLHQIQCSLSDKNHCRPPSVAVEVMETKGSIQLLLLGLFAASVASGVYGGRNAPSRMLAVEGPPVRFQECEHTFGPWPPTIPKGSSGWQDGQHGNMSTFLISFTNTGIKGIQTQWVSFLTADQTTPSFVAFTHGTITGKQKAKFTWKVRDPNNTPFVRLGGTYNNKHGLDTISFIDSNDNQYTWGNYEKPGPTSFFSPAGQGDVVGLFGASNKTHLTQIGVCMSGPK